MATVIIEVAGISSTLEISDNDANRILNAYRSMYTTQSNDPETGEPVENVPTIEETVEKIAQGVVRGLADQTVRYEQEAAADSARKAVPPIPANVVPV